MCRDAGRSRTLIQGQIETLTPDGVFVGWVRDAGRAAPCRVQLLVGEEVVAESVADLFRPDLLRAGHGHGHFGFEARLRRRLAPGACHVTMHLPDQGVSAPMGLDVPELAEAGAVAVEALLRAREGWCAQDVCDTPGCLAPGCLDVEADCAALGVPRSIDAVFRFALGRWPTRAEASMNATQLQAGRITPSALLLECLASRERAELPPDLPGPFSAAFPFKPATGGLGPAR